MSAKQRVLSWWRPKKVITSFICVDNLCTFVLWYYSAHSLYVKKFHLKLLKDVRDVAAFHYYSLLLVIRQSNRVHICSVFPKEPHFIIFWYIFYRVGSHYPVKFTFHYENTPIQIYWTFYNQKREIFQIKKFWYFSYFCSKHRLWVLVRTASSVLSRNKKNNVHPCKPSFTI